MDGLKGMADAAHLLAGTGGTLANSPAMSEIAHEPQIIGEDFDEPVHAAHSNASILRFASTDSVRQFARLFDSQPIPVYSHLAVARSGLECAALSFWLIDRRIDVKTRVQRYQLIRLHNAKQMQQSPIPEYGEQGKRLRTKVREQCSTRSWQVIANEKNIEVEHQRVPGSGKLIKELIAQGGNMPDLGLGATIWWFQSGVTHGATYALTESMEISNPDNTSPFVTNQVSILTNSRSVLLQAVVLGFGFQTLIDEHRHMFGWSSEEWDSQSQVFTSAVKQFLAMNPAA